MSHIVMTLCQLSKLFPETTMPIVELKTSYLFYL